MPSEHNKSFETRGEPISQRKEAETTSIAHEIPEAEPEVVTTAEIAVEKESGDISSTFESEIDNEKLNAYQQALENVQQDKEAINPETGEVLWALTKEHAINFLEQKIEQISRGEEKLPIVTEDMTEGEPVSEGRETGEIEKFKKAFEGLLTEANELEGEERIVALTDLALDRVRLGKFDQMEQIVAVISDTEEQDKFRYDLIDILLREGNVGYAHFESLLDGIKNEELKKDASEKVGTTKLMTIASGIKRLSEGKTAQAELDQLGINVKKMLAEIKKTPEITALSSEFGSAAEWLTNKASGDTNRTLELLGIKFFGALKYGTEKIGINKKNVGNKGAFVFFALFWSFCFSVEKGIQLIKYSMEKAGVKFPQYAQKAIRGPEKKRV